MLKRAVASIVVELGFIAVGGYVGGWLPTRNTVPGDDAPGTGIGVFAFGAIGMVVGAFAGLFAIALYWSIARGRRT